MVSPIVANERFSVNTYRVWMKDGYAGIYNAPDEEDAKRQAKFETAKAIKDCAMSHAEKLLAMQVDQVKLLNGGQP